MRLRAAIGAGLALASIAACGSSGDGATGTAQAASDASASPDASYFSGKTITWIIDEAPSGSYYVSATVLKPALEKYLHATIKLESQPAGSSIVGQDVLASSKPDGLTIGSISPFDDIYNILTGKPGVNFSLDKIVLLGALAPANVEAVAACSGSKFTSWDQVVNSPQAFDYLTTAGGAIEERGQLLFGAYNLKAHMLPGYENATSIIAGCLRGDGNNALEFIPITNGSPGDFGQGHIKPLLTLGTPSKASIYYNVLNGVPTLQQYIQAHPATSPDAKAALDYLLTSLGPTDANQSYAAPPGTPAAVAAILTQAFKAAFADPSVQAKLTSGNLGNSLLTPETAKQSIDSLLNNGDKIKKYLSYGV